MERVKGIEPSSQAWEARILPLNHTRFRWANLYQKRCHRAVPDLQIQLASAACADGVAVSTRVIEGAWGDRSSQRLPHTGYNTEVRGKG